MRFAGAVTVPGFRALGLFWAAVLSAVALGAIVLQVLGPPARRPREVVANGAGPVGPSERRAAIRPEAALSRSVERGPPSTRPGRETAGPIAPPEPALLEPAKDWPGASLPRIGPDGRMPSQAYARGFDPNNHHPRVAIILAGVGLNAVDSEDAIRNLPGEVTLAFSPYASRADRLLDAARSAGHEFLVSLPLEPQGYPLNDAGDQALLTSATPDQNSSRLDWALSRMAGYAGVTNALGLLRGERFADSTAQMGPVLQTLRSRGLFYIDARPGQPDPLAVWSRGVDVVVDDPPLRPDIDAKLVALEQIARDKGSAVGLIGAVRPVTVDRLSAWSGSLAAKGLTLAPASAVVKPAAEGAAP